jgi:hypothetical protein
MMWVVRVIPTIMVPMITFPIVIAARCKHCLRLVNPDYLDSRSNVYVLHNQLSRSASIIKEKPRHSELRIAGLANNQPQTVNYPQTKDLWASDFIADCPCEGLTSAPSV